MMELKPEKLWRGLQIEEYSGDPDIIPAGFTYDSRRVVPGDFFVCIEGFQHDGHDFISEAVAGGCGGVVVQDVPPGVNKIESQYPLAMHLSAAFMIILPEAAH